MTLKRGDRVRVNAPETPMSIEQLLSPAGYATAHHESTGRVYSVWHGCDEAYIRLDELGRFVSIPLQQLEQIEDLCLT